MSVLDWQAQLDPLVQLCSPSQLGSHSLLVSLMQLGLLGLLSLPLPQLGSQTLLNLPVQLSSLALLDGADRLSLALLSSPAHDSSTR